MKKLIALIILMPSPAYAGSSFDFLPAGLQLAGALILVVGIMLLLYHFSRKGLFGLLPSAKFSSIKVKEVRHLMPKKALYLIEIKGRELLLGVGTDRIELIAEFPGQPETSFAKVLDTNMEAGA